MTMESKIGGTGKILKLFQKENFTGLNLYRKTMFSAIGAGLILACNYLQGGDLKMESFFSHPEKNIIKTDKEKFTKLTLDFPAVPKKNGMSVCLKFNVYLTTKAAGGWNDYLCINLNNKKIGKYTVNGEKRLMGKPEYLKNTVSGWENRDWWTNDVLLVFFTPGTEVIDQRVISPREELCTYYIDISDNVNYVEFGADNRIEKNDENKLDFINTFFKDLGKGQDFTDVDMVIENFQVGYISSDVISSQGRSALVKFVSAPVAASIKSESYTLDVTQGGGMILKSGEDKYYIGAEYSYPGNTEMLFNVFSPEKASPWTPAIKELKNGTISINAASKAYSVKREITKAENGIKIRDTVTNTSANDTGIYIKYFIASENIQKAIDYNLAGLPGIDILREGVAENPTVFIKNKNSSAGMIADDNIQRTQLELTRFSNKSVFEIPHFGLRAGESYTFENTIYPLKAEKNYFSFINLIRKERDLNHTIEGPFVGWFRSPAAPGMNVSIKVIMSPWFEFSQGDDVILTRDEYKRQVQAKIKENKKQDAARILIPAVENNIVSINRLSLKDEGKILPPCVFLKGTYGLLLNQEQSALFKDNKYNDSFLRSADGRLYADTYYTNSKIPYINLLVQPAENNYRFKELLEIIDFMIDEVGFDGIYLDQAEPGGGFSRKDRFTFDKWDGHTVDLDAKGNIIRKYYDFAVAGADARRKIIEHVLAKSKKMVLNGQPMVKETDIPGIFRFTEMANDSLKSIIMFPTEKPCALLHSAKSHLSCSPITVGMRISNYVSDKKDYSKTLTRSIIAALRNGVLFYYTEYDIPLTGEGAGAYGPGNHMFPFTPVELNEGYLIGKERVITCVSGEYFWPGTQKPSCFLFDELGRDKNNSFRITQKDNGWTVDVQLNDWNEIAVIEK